MEAVSGSDLDERGNRVPVLLPAGLGGLEDLEVVLEEAAARLDLLNNVHRLVLEVVEFVEVAVERRQSVAFVAVERRGGGDEVPHQVVGDELKRDEMLDLVFACFQPLARVDAFNAAPSGETYSRTSLSYSMKTN